MDLARDGRAGARVGAGRRQRAGVLAGAWPPPGAEPVDLDGAYDRLAGAGLAYGPAFRGLARAWRLGGEVLAEVTLPEAEHEQAAQFGLHPALLDAALHAAALTGPQESAGRLPFSFSGVSLHAAGARALRVRLSGDAAGSLSVTVADPQGQLVATVGSLVTREFDPAQVDRCRCPRRPGVAVPAGLGPRPRARPGRCRDGAGSVRVGGRRSPGLRRQRGRAGARGARRARLRRAGGTDRRGRAVPATVMIPVPAQPGDGEGSVPDVVRAVTAGVLRQVQDWLADESYASSRLVFLTRGAVAGPGGDGRPTPAWRRASRPGPHGAWYARRRPSTPAGSP